MKAKFIAVNGKFEIRLEDGTVYTSNAGENSKTFTKRVKEAAALDVGDLDISELTIDAFAKLTVEQLATAKAKESGLLAELLQSAIDSRATKGMSDEAKTNIANQQAAKTTKVDADKAKADAAAKKIADKAIADKAKADAAEKKAADKVAKKAEREAIKAEKPSLEDVIAAATEAKKNVGHAVKFSPHRTALKTEGIINGVWVDKRVPMALYRIFDADGVMYNTLINNPSLEIGELVPNQKAEAAAAKKAEKEAEKTAATEKKIADKAIADQAKKDAAEKKAADKIIADQTKKDAAAKKAEEKAIADQAKADQIAAKVAAATKPEVKA